MKKKLIVLVSALFAFEGLVAMDNVENANENSLQRPKITSLSGGMEILPGMRSEKLYFKPIIYPKKWDQYKGSSQMDILDKYLLKIANAGTDDPRKLYDLTIALSDGLDMDIYYYETDQEYAGDPYDIITYMIYARVLEMGIWEARFVTVGFISNRKSILEPLTDCLIYNDSPVPLQMLPIASLYIDLLYAIKNSEEEVVLRSRPGVREMYAAYPHMVSAMLEEIKSAPLPTTNYFSWAFEKASDNLEAQKCWPLFSK